ncbi:MAG: MotA/TolQ/ExbB proton channel family protein [SAR324 cluster bacterium]|nr:MotA/TolQ/ExbB proton channel family protein [SAR324 cluster bacterium]
MKCLKCGKHNSEITIYCAQCGSYLAAENYNDQTDTIKALALSLMTTPLVYLFLKFVDGENANLTTIFSGHVSEAITALSLWSLYLVMIKYFTYRTQRRSSEIFRGITMHELIIQGIYVQDVRKISDQITDILRKSGIKSYQTTIIYRRIRRILQYIQAVPKKEEAHGILNYQAEIDFNHMENGYVLLNVFIWAIPILGFIGTVMGIGDAIGEFSEFIRGLDSVNIGGQMRSALGGVTSGLSLAFNTTFLALLFVIPIMMLTSFLHKAEERLLLGIEEYCLEELLPNLHIQPVDEIPSQTADEHLYRLMRFSENWVNQISPLLTSVTQYAEALKYQVEGLHPLVRDFSNQFFQVKDTVSQQQGPTPDSSSSATAVAETLGETPADTAESDKSNATENLTKFQETEHTVETKDS